MIRENMNETQNLSYKAFDKLIDRALELDKKDLAIELLRNALAQAVQRIEELESSSDEA